MSSQQPDDEELLKPTFAPGYKVSAAKSTEEYAQLDADDPSLARWKASLGIVPGAAPVATGPKLTVLTLELHSHALPAGRSITVDVTDQAKLAALEDNPIILKEGIEYNVRISFNVNHSIVSGLRYIQVAKRHKITVDKVEQMIGSYGPHPDGKPYHKDFETEESPSGMLLRGTYDVRSRVVDDDGEVYADWKWSFKLTKDWD